jgi:DNA-binding Lrp family transcriptional regulator
MSDQTYRDGLLKELDETVINRDASGIISLGSKYEALKQENKKDQWVIQRQKILGYVQNHPGKTSEEIAAGVHITKPTVVSILETLVESSGVKTFGAGVRGDPQTYFGDESARKRHESAPKPKELTELEDSRRRLEETGGFALASPHNPYWTDEIAKLERTVAELSRLEESCTN